MTDVEFLNAFESCALPEGQWTHRAHVRMAWLYLQRLRLSQAIPIVREGIKRYNSSLKKSLSYHETITQAFLYLISDRITTGDGTLPFEHFCEQNPDLLDRQMSVLLKHYQKETLFSQAARDTFISPDLFPFPKCDFDGTVSSC